MVEMEMITVGGWRTKKGGKRFGVVTGRVAKMETGEMDAVGVMVVEKEAETGARRKTRGWKKG